MRPRAYRHPGFGAVYSSLHENSDQFVPRFVRRELAVTRGKDVDRHGFADVALIAVKFQRFFGVGATTLPAVCEG